MFSQPYEQVISLSVHVGGGEGRDLTVKKTWKYEGI